jgi:chorismate-pyruvate lyase
MTADAPLIGSTGPPTGSRGAVRLATALDRADGTVTALLEGVAGEPIDAVVVAQATRRAGPGSELGLRPSDPVLERAALLTGRETGRVFVYAESQIAADRLSDQAVARLLGCRDPIGRILTEDGFEPKRRLLGRSPEPTVHVGTTDPLAAGVALARRSVITVDSEPTVLVSEWFLDTLVAALVAAGR